MALYKEYTCRTSYGSHEIVTARSGAVDQHAATCSKDSVVFRMPPPERLSTHCVSSSTLVRGMDLAPDVKVETDPEEEAMQREIQDMGFEAHRLILHVVHFYMYT